jgi:hypothetical protein
MGILEDSIADNRRNRRNLDNNDDPRCAQCGDPIRAGLSMVWVHLDFDHDHWAEPPARARAD